MPDDTNVIFYHDGDPLLLTTDPGAWDKFAKANPENIVPMCLSDRHWQPKTKDNASHVVGMSCSSILTSVEIIEKAKKRGFHRGPDRRIYVYLTENKYPWQDFVMEGTDLYNHLKENKPLDELLEDGE